MMNIGYLVFFGASICPESVLRLPENDGHGGMPIFIWTNAA